MIDSGGGGTGQFGQPRKAGNQCGVMPALARDFEVIAVDQRGMGLSDKPAGGYDTGTQARDLIGLMDALGHERFAAVGHDTGLAISYALTADHPDRVERVALLEIPGSPETVTRRRCSSPGPPEAGTPEHARRATPRADGRQAAAKPRARSRS